MSVEFKDDLEIATMNRVVEIGQEGHQYRMQPRIMPGILPQMVNFPAGHFYKQPEIPATVYQMQPEIPASIYEAQPEIKPKTFDAQEELEPVAFNRPLDNGNAGNYFLRQPRISPENYNLLPQVEPVNFYLPMQIDPQNYLMQPRILPLNHIIPTRILPLNHIIPTRIDPINFQIDLPSEPTNFNRPLEMAPMVYQNRDITGTDPRFNGIEITGVEPVNMNREIVDEEDQTTVSPTEGTTVEASTPAETTIGVPSPAWQS